MSGLSGAVELLLSYYRAVLTGIQTEVTGDPVALDVVSGNLGYTAYRGEGVRDRLSAERERLALAWQGQAFQSYNDCHEGLLAHLWNVDDQVRHHAATIDRAAAGLRQTRGQVDQVLAWFDQAARVLIARAGAGSVLDAGSYLADARQLGQTSVSAAQAHSDALGQLLLQVAAELGGPEPVPIPPGVPAGEAEQYAELRRRCAEIQARQLADANAMKGDGKYWFAKVYSYVTLEELKQIDAGVYKYPMVKLQEIIAFDATYQRNLHAWQAGAKDQVEPNWQHAFAAAEYENGGTWYKPHSMEVMGALVPSMQAHIRFDLPRAIADVYEKHYAGTGLTMEDLRPDFNAMQPVFDRATEDIRSEIETGNTWADPGNWDGLTRAAFPFVFDVPQERAYAYERAQVIISGHDQGITGDAMQDRIMAYQGGAHPMVLNRNALGVDGEYVPNYNWEGQR